MEIKLSNIKVINLTLFFFACLFFFLYFYLNNPSRSTLKINEISFSNADGVDWIEIYNPSLNTMSLKGMYLTDNKMNLKKYQIRKDIIIEPNSFVVIYGKNYKGDTQNTIKVNFSIKNGETVYLIDGGSFKTIDSLTVVSDEKNTSSGSMGRFPDGSTETFLMQNATKGEKNTKDQFPLMVK